MLKFLDDVVTGIGYFFFCAVVIVITGITFHYYPTLTLVFLGLLIFSPVISWLDKQITKINRIKISLSKPLKSPWQSFKDGFDKGRN